MVLISIGRFIDRFLVPVINLFSIAAFIIFIVYIIKYFISKTKKKLIIGLVSLSLSILSMILTIILSFSMFFLGSLGRYGMFSEDYYYPSHIYNYYAYADYDNPVVNENIEKEFPGLFEIRYGISAFYQRQVIEPVNSDETRKGVEPNVRGSPPDGEKILLRGPPFGFHISFWKISHDINYFSFKEITMKTDSGETHDLIKSLEGLSGEFGRYSNEYTVKIEDNALDIFIRTGKININRFITQGRINAVNNPRNKNENIDQMIDEGYIQIGSTFWDIPIDYKKNESVTIRFVFDIVMNNGEINNFIFDDTYNRKYIYYEKEFSPTPPKSFGQSDWNKSLSNGTFRQRMK
ncbi:MAG: hypothetical protein LBV17_07215 [Treponema sp.]|jgi:hypothetical protein|nr:hypothetical protein [Treponema sp.]